MRDVQVTLADDAVEPFSAQVRDFAPRGKSGIEYAITSFTRDELRERGVNVPAGPLSDVHIVESLLYRDKHGKVRGILHHHANALPPIAEEHEIQVSVDPRFRGKGIATKLLCEALERWPIDLEAQRYTTAGAAFIRHFMGTAEPQSK